MNVLDLLSHFGSALSGFLFGALGFAVKAKLSTAQTKQAEAQADQAKAQASLAKEQERDLLVDNYQSLVKELREELTRVNSSYKEVLLELAALRQEVVILRQVIATNGIDITNLGISNGNTTAVHQS